MLLMAAPVLRQTPQMTITHPGMTAVRAPRDLYEQ
jgi:hypothetical protein